jgi:sugar phosphate isomerase/epimerase
MALRLAVKSATTEPAHWLRALEQLPPGFTGLSLDCPFPLPDIPPAVVQPLRALRAEHAVSYFIHTPVGRVQLGALDPDLRQASLAEVGRAIALAAQVGAGLITVHPTPSAAYRPGFEAQVEDLERQALQQLCVAATAQDVTVAVENMPPGGAFPAQCSDFSGFWSLLDQIPSLGVTLDVGHAHVARVSLADTVHRLGRRLRHVHVHDNDGAADQHRPVGYGTVDWRALLTALSDISYSGFLELEFPGYAAHVAAARFLRGL